LFVKKSLTMHPSIELFRGIAAWMVLTMHYAYFLTPEPSFLAFLWTGVDFFFVISGFVFGRAIYAGNLAVLPFLIRRFFRIYPLYFCSLILYYWFSADHPDKFSFFINHLFFLHTTHSVEEAFFFNPAYWSLPVEMEFYLLVPLLALVAARYKYFILILFISFLLFRIVIVLNPSELLTPYLSTVLSVHLPGILIEFMLGVLLFKLYLKYQNKKIPLVYHVLIMTIAITLLLALSLFLTWYGDEGIHDNFFLKIYFNFLCALGYSILLFPFLMIIKAKQSFLNSSCLFMGNISYGVYVFHNLIPLIMKQLGIQLSGFLGYFLCSFAVVILALVFYYAVENPSRLFGRKLSKKLVRIAKYKQ